FHQRIEASLRRAAGGVLEIVYTLHGLNLDLRVPTPHAPAPADALWQSTCCELFLAPTGQAGYREFNFSPSGQWAAYDFSAPRQRVPRPYAGPAPHQVFVREEALMKLTVSLPAAALPKAETLRLALAVILAAAGGYQGYWALSHPPGPPDFHHPAGFLLSLGPDGFRPAHWP
ncbi:MAG: hypothetical protein N2690_07875, partial [Rhodocyclaceae bacterium]|nr:hypothetical protein [Rhodocyclaceae bacterium]